ncbi:MAG: EVE domain-containing protein [Chromatiales bacterium]|jgi:predicted RNA-binding protein with PUA-like domain|nr:EVE domain-containing protein [Chromatiales bacterium]
MNYWLFKSEPNEFSIEALEKMPRKTEHWDGVRNYQARNFMRDEMRKGELGFFYHSSCAEPGIVGIIKISKEAYPDHTAFDPTDKHFDPKSDPQAPRWFMVNVTLVEKFREPITLKTLKSYADRQLADFRLLARGNRLSVMPIEKKHWKFINSLR